MEIEFLKQSLTGNIPPSGTSVYVQAMWHDAKDNWDKAHELIQDLADKNASWIHAYLHRKEGDLFNADYWYNKAGKIKQAKSDLCFHLKKNGKSSLMHY